ncbi:uncharacterized protein LOC141851080 isoform X2 [Brevipalpus obovatus]
MFEGDRSRFIPRTDQDMDKHCKIMNDNTKCIERHSRCYRPFAKQIFGTAMSHLKKAYKKRCLVPEGREEFLYHMSCIKNENFSEPAHQCSDKWTIMIKTINKNTTDPVVQLPLFCCSFHLFRECLIDSVTELCKNSTGPASAQYIEGTISDAVAEFMDLACNKHSSKEDCDKNQPRGMARLRRIMAKDVQPQNTSPLFHFLQFAIKYDH